MTPEEQQAFEDKIYAYVGKQVCPRTPAKDAVNAAMIRHWAEAMGDSNPAYQDEAWAASSSRGHLIAPPAMMYTWGQEGFQVTKGRAPNAMSNLVAKFNEYGFTGVLGTNVKQEYTKEVGLGDNITTHMVIDNISERKMTARGPGYFFETEVVLRGEVEGGVLTGDLAIIGGGDPNIYYAHDFSKSPKQYKRRGGI